jgi:hypothetical protein
MTSFLLTIFLFGVSLWVSKKYFMTMYKIPEKPFVVLRECRNHTGRTKYEFLSDGSVYFVRFSAEDGLRVEEKKLNDEEVKEENIKTIRDRVENAVRELKSGNKKGYYDMLFLNE